MTKKITIVSAEEMRKLWAKRRPHGKGRPPRELKSAGYKPATAMTVGDFQNLPAHKWRQRLVDIWEERKAER